MGNTDLNNYKANRIVLEKSFIGKLNDSLNETNDSWNNLSKISQVIHKADHEIIYNDLSKMIKSTITGLRAMKKMQPQDILDKDISDLMEFECKIPQSKNQFAWLTRFRTVFGQANCFVRSAFFDMIGLQKLSSMDIVSTLQNCEMFNLNEKTKFEQIQIVMDIVDKMYETTISSPSMEISDEALLSGNFEQISCFELND